MNLHVHRRAEEVAELAASRKSDTPPITYHDAIYCIQYITYCILYIYVHYILYSVHYIYIYIYIYIHVYIHYI